MGIYAVSAVAVAAAAAAVTDAVVNTDVVAVAPAAVVAATSVDDVDPTVAPTSAPSIAFLRFYCYCGYYDCNG